MIYLLIPLSFLIHILLFAFFYFISGRFFQNKTWFQSLGKKLFKLKEKQLNNNSLLKVFARSVENGAMGKARFIIFVLILLKSVGMILLGFIGLSLIIVPLQAVMMAALIQRTNHEGVPEEDLLSVAGIQLAAMTTATVLGNLIGWRHFIDRLWFHTIFDQDQYLLLTASLILIVLCLITSSKEVKFYQANRRLIN